MEHLHTHTQAITAVAAISHDLRLCLRAKHISRHSGCNASISINASAKAQGLIEARSKDACSGNNHLRSFPLMTCKHPYRRCGQCESVLHAYRH